MSIDKIDQIVELSLLYDFYGELLKEHTKQIFEDYILNDLSLSEIAEEAGISRQGVHDIVKRGTKQLLDYEENLKLIKKYRHSKLHVSRIKELLKEMKESGNIKANDLARIEEIEQLSDYFIS